MKKMTFFRKIIPVFVKISKKAQKKHRFPGALVKGAHAKRFTVSPLLLLFPAYSPLITFWITRLYSAVWFSAAGLRNGFPGTKLFFRRFPIAGTYLPGSW